MRLNILRVFDGVIVFSKLELVLNHMLTCVIAREKNVDPQC